MNEDDFLYAPITKPEPESTELPKVSATPPVGASQPIINLVDVGGGADKTVIWSFQNNPLLTEIPLLSAAQLLGFENALLQQLALYQQQAHQQVAQQGLQNYQNQFYKSQSEAIMEGQTQQLANQFAGETSCGVFTENFVARSGW
jgi:hypothetical protein